jgi:hypothetical protein
VGVCCRKGKRVDAKGLKMKGLGACAGRCMGGAGRGAANTVWGPVLEDVREVPLRLVRWGKYHHGWNAHALQLHLMAYDTAVGRQRKNAEEGPTLLQTDLLLCSSWPHLPHVLVHHSSSRSCLVPITGRPCCSLFPSHIHVDVVVVGARAHRGK